MVSEQLDDRDYESPLVARHFYNEGAAYRYLEAQLWGAIPKCPHCGGTDRVKPLKGTSHRVGVYNCYTCVKPFTVKVGTLFHGSRFPMHTWLKGIYLVAGSNDRITAEELMHVLGISRATAQYMLVRIRVALKWREGQLNATAARKELENETDGKSNAKAGENSLSSQAYTIKRKRRFRL